MERPVGPIPEIDGIPTRCCTCGEARMDFQTFDGKRYCFDFDRKPNCWELFERSIIFAKEIAEGVEILGPFGNLTSAEGARRAAYSKLRKRESLADAEARRQEAITSRLTGMPKREQLALRAAAVVHMMAEKILTEEIPVKSAAEAAKINDAFFAVLRLESGQSTGQVDHVSRDAALSAIADLRDRAEKRKPA